VHRVNKQGKSRGVSNLESLALLNEVLSGDGSDRAIKQAVTVLVIALKARRI